MLAFALPTYFHSTRSAGAQDVTPTPQAKKDAPDEKAIRALIAQLGDDSFDKREAAQKALAAIGLPAFELLRKASTDAADLESRERASQLVKEMNHLRFRPMVKDKLWGNSVDPDGDCLFHVDLGKLHIKIPGTPHRLGIESGAGAINAPRVLQEIEGDFNAEVQVPLSAPTAKQNHLGKYPWYGAGIVVWQDDKNYLRLERARIIFGQNNAPSYTSWELRSGGKHTRKGAVDEGRLDDAEPAILKLDRKGKIFTAAYSQDGKAWKDLPPITVDLAKRLSVGVTASHNTSAAYEAVFDRLKITPSK
jgi:hypothetical protein